MGWFMYTTSGFAFSAAKMTYQFSVFIYERTGYAGPYCSRLLCWIFN